MMNIFSPTYAGPLNAGNSPVATTDASTRPSSARSNYIRMGRIKYEGDEGLSSRDAKAFGGWPVFDPHTEAELPPGTPTWITTEFVLRTLNVWQPFYTTRLTTDDALEIIGGFGRLADILKSVA